MSETPLTQGSQRGRMAALVAGVGLTVGAPAGFFVGRAIKAAHRTHPLGWSEVLSLALAAILLLCGVGLLLVSLSRSGAAYVADPHGSEPGRTPKPTQIHYFRRQAAVLALAGAMLAVPVAAPLIWPDMSYSARALAWLGLVAVFAAQTWLNLMVWRHSDELIRRATSEGAAVSFWLLQALLFLYAAAEKLRLAPALTSWDSITVLMGLYLILSITVAWRRGLH